MKTRILFAPIGSQAYMVKQAVEYGRGWKRAKCMTFAIEFCVGRSLAKVINITHFLTYWMLMMHVKCIHPIKAYLSRLKSLQQNYTKHLWRSNGCAGWDLQQQQSIAFCPVLSRHTSSAPAQYIFCWSTFKRAVCKLVLLWHLSRHSGNLDQMEFHPCRCLKESSYIISNASWVSPRLRGFPGLRKKFRSCLRNSILSKKGATGIYDERFQ